MGVTMVEPLPCFVCGKLPTVDRFLLMDLRHLGWTALCPSRCYETAAYCDREGAVADWNTWVESEGYTDDDDGWGDGYDDEDEWNERMSEEQA